MTPALPGQDTARVFLHRWQGWSAGMVTCCSFLKILLISCAAMMPYDTRKSEIMGGYWRLSMTGCPVRSFSIPVEPSTVRDPLWGQNCRATSHLCPYSLLCILPAQGPINPILDLYQEGQTRSPRTCHAHGDSSSTITSPGTNKSCPIPSTARSSGEAFQAGSVVVVLYGIRTFLSPSQ